MSSKSRQEHKFLDSIHIPREEDGRTLTLAERRRRIPDAVRSLKGAVRAWRGAFLRAETLAHECADIAGLPIGEASVVDGRICGAWQYSIMDRIDLRGRLSPDGLVKIDGTPRPPQADPLQTMSITVDPITGEHAIAREV